MRPRLFCGVTTTFLGQFRLLNERIAWSCVCRHMKERNHGLCMKTLQPLAEHTYNTYRAQDPF